MVGSFLGTPICTDEIITEGRRLEYARLCILLEADSVFSEEVRLAEAGEEGTLCQIKYEWRPQA